jgi:hypothetical protein
MIGVAAMANTLPVSSLVKGALGLLEVNSVLANLVYRDAEKEFVGGVGDTVRVRVPETIDAVDGTGQPTTFTDINEGTIPVTLSAEAYNAVKLSDREMTLDLINFGAQVLQPQASGIAKFCEQTISAQMNAASTASGETIDPVAPLGAFVKAAAEFTRREIPLQGRIMAVGPAVFEALLSVPSLQDAAAAGGDDVISGGRFKRLLGFDVHVSPYLDGAVAFTREGFALAVRAPQNVDGASKAATERHNGYALRYVRDFDISQRADVSLLSTFVGATQMDARRVMAFAIAPAGA